MGLWIGSKTIHGCRRVHYGCTARGECTGMLSEVVRLGMWCSAPGVCIKAWHDTEWHASYHVRNRARHGDAGIMQAGVAQGWPRQQAGVHGAPLVVFASSDD